MMQKDKRYIAFVCTGNTCRSAMAAAIMADIAEKNDLDVVVDSAGVFATIGECAAVNAIEAVKKYGVDLSLHRTKPLTEELIDMADVILVMTDAHKMLIENMAKEKVFTLLEFAGDEGPCLAVLEALPEAELYALVLSGGNLLLLGGEV